MRLRSGSWFSYHECVYPALALSDMSGELKAIFEERTHHLADIAAARVAFSTSLDSELALLGPLGQRFSRFAPRL
jgi:hypothetical protein